MPLGSTGSSTSPLFKLWPSNGPSTWDTPKPALKKTKVMIPDLPPSVKYTEPKLPDKAAKDSEETKPILEGYEEANAKNKKAIEDAQAHMKAIQKLYNVK